MPQNCCQWQEDKAQGMMGTQHALSHPQMRNPSGEGRLLG